MTACTKRPFSSKRQAREAHGKAGYRLRIYWCPEHHAFHVANAEKRHVGHGRARRRL